MAAAFTTITTDVVSSNLDQSKVYNINRLLYSVMYNMETYCTSLYCIINLYWTRVSSNTDEYNIFQYCTYHCIMTYLLYSWNDQYYNIINFIVI